MWDVTVCACLGVFNFFQEEVKEFLRKQEAGELVSQKVGRHFGVASEAMPTSALHEDGCVHFGDQVVLEHPSSESIVSALPSPFPTVNPDIPVTGSPGAEPMRRTVFKIVPADPAKHQEDEPIRYGDRFRVFCSVPSHGTIYLMSEKLGLHNTPARFSRFQNVFSRVVEEGTDPGNDASWEFVYRDPNFRFENEGQPVEANQPVLLRHARSGLCLCVLSKFMWRTEFGKQYEVAAHTHINSHKVESDENVLVVRMGAQQGQGQQSAHTSS